MSDCREIRERLALWAGGDLPADETAAVDEHLAGCAECRAAAEAWREDLRTIVRGATGDAAPELDAAFLDEVIAAAQGGTAEPQRSAWSRFLQIAAPLAAMLAVALLWRFIELPVPDRDPALGAVRIASWEDLQEEFDGCLDEPVDPATWRAESGGGLIAVLSPAASGEGYVVADCIEVRDLARLRRFPWLEQRLDGYRLTDEGEREIVLAACPTGGLDRAARRGVRSRVLERFGGAG